MKKLKQITIMGTIWDNWPILKLFERTYESKYISIYDPWLTGVIDKKKILELKEKKKSFIFLPFKILRRTFYFIKIIIIEKPNLIITHHDDANTSILPTILLNKILRFARKAKFVLWIRNNPIQTYGDNSFFSKFQLFIYRNFYRFTDILIVQNKANFNILEKNFPNLKNKIKIIPNIYNVKNNILKSKEGIENKYNDIFNKKDFIFFNLGRLTEQKAQWNLIRVFSEVNKIHKNSKLVIIGEGELRKDLEDLAKKLDVFQSVHFIGKQTNVFKFMNKSSCLVLTSLWEGMPNTILESLSINLPIISTDCKTGPREILAPNLRVNSKIKYPYYGEFGILIKPFKREFNFKTVKESKFSLEEEILFNLMKKAISNSNFLLEFKKKGRKRSLDYDINTLEKKKVFDLFND